MDRDRIAGYWRQLRGTAQQRWSRLTANYAGVHGVAKGAREKQLAEWQAREHKADPIHK